MLLQSRHYDWNPFAEMQRLQSNMNNLFERPRAQMAAYEYPPVNVWLGDNSVVVTAELPGLSEDDLNLSVREDTLTMKGERKFAANDNQVAWHRRERRAGTFERTIQLPFRVDADMVQANFENGVLEIEMQRPKADRPRKIEVKSV